MTREEIIITVAKEIAIALWGGKGGEAEYMGEQFKKITKKVEEALDSIKK